MDVFLRVVKDWIVFLPDRCLSHHFELVRAPVGRGLGQVPPVLGHAGVQDRHGSSSPSGNFYKGVVMKGRRRLR